MEILGIGVPELVFILLIALIVLGPRDMQKAGKTVGRWLRNIVTSQTWQDIRAASRKLSTLPNELIREANLDDLDRQIKGYHSDDKATAPQNDSGAWGSGEENSMQQTDKNTTRQHPEPNNKRGQKSCFRKRGKR